MSGDEYYYHFNALVECVDRTWVPVAISRYDLKAAEEARSFWESKGCKCTEIERSPRTVRHD